MKKNVVILLGTTMLLGCSKTEYVYVSSENNQESNSIVGVWELPYDSLFFCSFGSDGKYYYCLKSNLIASGSYTRDGDKINLTNYMQNGMQESLTINIISNDEIKFSGNLYVDMCNSTPGSTIADIDMCMKKVNRPFACSLAGEEWFLGSGLSPTLGDIKTYLQFESSWEGKKVIKYKHNGSWVEYSSSWFKYVYIYDRAYIQYYTNDIGGDVVVYIQ